MKLIFRWLPIISCKLLIVLSDIQILNIFYSCMLKNPWQNYFYGIQYNQPQKKWLLSFSNKKIPGAATPGFFRAACRAFHVCLWIFSKMLDKNISVVYNISIHKGNQMVPYGHKIEPPGSASSQGVLFGLIVGIMSV